MPSIETYPPSPPSDAEGGEPDMFLLAESEGDRGDRSCTDTKSKNSKF